MTDLPVFISTHEPLVLFSLPYPAEEEEWQSSFGGHLDSSQAQYITTTMKYIHLPNNITVLTFHRIFSLKIIKAWHFKKKKIKIIRKWWTGHWQFNITDFIQVCLLRWQYPCSVTGNVARTETAVAWTLNTAFFNSFTTLAQDVAVKCDLL